MKRPILLALLLLVAPSAARAQLEVGLDAGFVLHTGFESSDDVTRISIPTGWGRLGLPLGDLLGFETLLGFDRISSGDSSASQLSFLPGLNVWLGILVMSLILGVGLSWSIVRRRLTGQADIDDVDE